MGSILGLKGDLCILRKNRRKIDEKMMKIDKKLMITHRSIIRLNFIKYVSHKSIRHKISDILLLSEFKYDVYLSIARVVYN